MEEEYKVSPPYIRRLCSYPKLPEYQHIRNAPYVLTNGNNDNYSIYYLWEIIKEKHHSLRKEDNQMKTDQSSPHTAWRCIATINIKCEKVIDVVLYSRIDDLLWFIFDPTHQTGSDISSEYEIMGYSIQHNKSL